MRDGEFEGTLLGKYLQTVHYFDTVFGEFLTRLEADGLLDQSVLVVYGDHAVRRYRPETEIRSAPHSCAGHCLAALLVAHIRFARGKPR